VLAAEIAQFWSRSFDLLFERSAVEVRFPVHFSTSEGSLGGCQSRKNDKCDFSRGLFCFQKASFSIAFFPQKRLFVSPAFQQAE
jgi:hypothetical protein